MCASWICQPRHFRTQFGGLFLFVPYLTKIPLERMLEQAGFPGTQQIPAAQAMRSLLALKLFGSARHSHVMSSVFDRGIGALRRTQRDPEAQLPHRVQLPDCPGAPIRSS